MEKKEYIENRYILSFWIFILALLFYINLINYNPILLLYLSVIVCVIQIIIFIYKKINYTNLIKYIILILLVHLIPVYLLYNRKINYIYDIILSLIVIILYIIFNKINNQSIINNYNDLIENHIDRSKGRPTYTKYLFDKYIFRIF